MGWHVYRGKCWRLVRPKKCCPTVYSMFSSASPLPKGPLLANEICEFWATLTRNGSSREWVMETQPKFLAGGGALPSWQREGWLQMTIVAAAAQTNDHHYHKCCNRLVSVSALLALSTGASLCAYTNCAANTYVCPLYFPSHCGDEMLTRSHHRLACLIAAYFRICWPWHQLCALLEGQLFFE